MTTNATTDTNATAPPITPDKPTTPASSTTGATPADPPTLDPEPDEPAPKAAATKATATKAAATKATATKAAARDAVAEQLPIPVKPLSRTELFRLASDLRLACMRISRRVRTESDLLLPPHQFSVLSRLEDGAKTNSELAELERISAPSMKRTTNCLVEEGYVGRADDPSDGRQVILSLTPEGLKTLRRIRRHRDEWMLRRFEHLTEDELAVLVSARDLLMGVANE